MEFQHSVIELIKKRRSCRSYENRDIDDAILRQLKDCIAEINKEAKAKVRFVFTNNREEGRTAQKLGTYGFISGAHSFLVGILDKGENDSLTLGFQFEKIILKATDLGLQTCWLGGTFNRKQFEENIGLLPNEFIPIVSPVGIGKDKPRVFESVMRASVGANQRKPWSELFFAENLSAPLDERGADPYTDPIEMVRLGPSASNKQPWRIIKDGNGYHFFLCRTKGYGSKSYDLQKNDLGIARCHFELSAKELGLKGKWQQTNIVKPPDEWEYISTWAPEAHE